MVLTIMELTQSIYGGTQITIQKTAQLKTELTVGKKES